MIPLTLTHRTNYIRLIFFALLMGIVACQPKHKSEINIKQGIYDGSIGKDAIILVVEETSPDSITGFYIHNRGQAIEDRQRFVIASLYNTVEFHSPNYNGTLIGQSTENHFKGNLHIAGKKTFFKFLKKKKNTKSVVFTKRETIESPIVARYKTPVFKQINTETDLVYGKAVGYWTETPYLDDSYISILSRGMVNSMKGEKEHELLLDIYYPDGDTHQLKPLVLLVHGGAFYIGNKNSSTETILAEAFTKRGYVVASINYRMGFRLRGYDVERSGYKAIQDAHAALRYLSHHAKKYGIDPSHVYVAGNSAGGITALNIAYLTNNERPKNTYAIRWGSDLGNIESSGNSLNAKFEVKAVGNMWGAITDTSIIKKSKNIPVISFHGDKDDIVPIGHDFPFRNTFRFNRLVMDKVYGSRPIHEQLNRNGTENKLVVFEGVGHEPQLTNFKSINQRMDLITNELIQFFFKQTAPQISIGKTTIKMGQNIEPLNIKLKNGTIVKIEVTGGLQSTADPAEDKIIWFSDAKKTRITVWASNKHMAINAATAQVKILTAD